MEKENGKGNGPWGYIGVIEDPKAKQALDFEKPKGITIDIKHPVNRHRSSSALVNWGACSVSEGDPVPTMVIMLLAQV